MGDLEFTRNKAYWLLKMKFHPRFRKVPLYRLRMLLSLGDEGFRYVMENPHFDNYCIQVYCITNNQVFHAFNEYVDKFGLHGWGGLGEQMVSFLSRLEENKVLLSGLLTKEVEPFVFSVSVLFDYRIQPSMAYLARSQGLKFCLFDNIYGNMFGVYDNDLLTKDDLDYLFATFNYLESNNIEYELTSGNRGDHSVRIKEL